MPINNNELPILFILISFLLWNGLVQLGYHPNYIFFNQIHDIKAFFSFSPILFFDSHLADIVFGYTMFPERNAASRHVPLSPIKVILTGNLIPEEYNTDGQYHRREGLLYIAPVYEKFFTPGHKNVLGKVG